MSQAAAPIVVFGGLYEGCSRPQLTLHSTQVLYEVYSRSQLMCSCNRCFASRSEEMAMPLNSAQVFYEGCSRPQLTVHSTQVLYKVYSRSQQMCAYNRWFASRSEEMAMPLYSAQASTRGAPARS